MTEVGHGSGRRFGRIAAVGSFLANSAMLFAGEGSIAMTITVKPRHPALGAEIHGIDMRRPLDAATVQEIVDAWMKHLVVVFPDQPITDAQHVAFTRQLGEPEIFHQTSLHLRSDRVKEIFLVSNVDEQDRLMRPPSRRRSSSPQRGCGTPIRAIGRCRRWA